MSSLKNIVIKGAREHNLKNINLTIPRDKLVVITGVSGSGKSSLAFDTIYAEGQRRYVESLSSYARQFLGQMQKPEVDYIEGLSPAISIEQKAAAKNPRSTVGTVTEIYDYLRLLFTHIGKPFCYNCGNPISKQTVDEIIQKINEIPEKTKIMILAPKIMNRKGEYKKLFQEIQKNGFTRVFIDDKFYDLQEEEVELDKNKKHNIDIVIDRLIIKDGIEKRLTDSVEIALKEGEGILKIYHIKEEKITIFSEKHACIDCGISYKDVSPQIFSFNSPIGMCQECNGLGTVSEIDEDLIIEDKSKSIYDGAISFFGDMNKKSNSWTLSALKCVADHYGFDLNTPFKDLSEEFQSIILFGSKEKIKFKYKSDIHDVTFMREYEGVIPTIKRRFKQTQSEGARKYYARFMSQKPCPHCNGNKLNHEALSYKINHKNIIEVTKLTIQEAYNFFENIDLNPREAQISAEIIKEIKNRLTFLMNVGLYYLTLDRKAPTLSGGESQRIRLASQIGSGLVGVLYVLDEPSIGLHQRDNEKLINSLKYLRDTGNTVIVVEHDEDTMRNADFLIDIGPAAGINGGQIIEASTLDIFLKSKDSLTAKF